MGTVKTFVDDEQKILTPALDSFIDKYLDAHMDERMDEAPELCECFVNGFIAACKPEDFDDLSNEEQVAIEEKAFDRLSDYQFDLVYGNTIEEAVALYKGYHEIADVPDALDEAA